MWGSRWREALWDELRARQTPWDVVVVGGGIAGAGVLREAVRAGLSALLLEGRDFAWGTSSRSSKLVHGGIRYLHHGYFRLTREALRERDRLLAEAPGLVEPLLFLRAVYEGERAQRGLYRMAFAAYGLLAGRRQHTDYDAAEVIRLLPGLSSEGLLGAYGYGEAAVDDARLVLRLLREAVRAGGRALSYCPVESLLTEQGAVAGVHARDVESGRTLEIRARAVVNATGARADHLRGGIGARPLLRPLRGSHLVFPAARLPLVHALSCRHPRDGRNVFVAPWEGTAVVGTTDCDHEGPLDAEPRISAPEVAYLMQVVTEYFPAARLGRADIVSTWAGVRPVIGHGPTDPSSESREGLLVDEQGLVSITGGTLTTVRATARAALESVRARCPGMRILASDARFFDEVDAQAADHPALTPAAWRRLRGRHGRDAAAVVAAAREGELEAMPGGPTLWAELRWAARAEGVRHLDDLLLRRVRLGLVQPEGGVRLLPSVRAVVEDELAWSDERWDAEETAYQALWRETFAVPAGGDR